MYLPRQFDHRDPAVTCRLLREHPLASLISTDGGFRGLFKSGFLKCRPVHPSRGPVSCVILKPNPILVCPRVVTMINGAEPSSGSSLSPVSTDPMRSAA